MATMTVYNKGKRLWLKNQVHGLNKDIAPNDSDEVDEAVARRLVMDYPRDFALTGKASPSNAELERREQSIRDREANLDKRAKELDEREAALNAREKETSKKEGDDSQDAEKPKTATKPKAGGKS